MSLKAIYANESEIPEGLSKYFKEQHDGSFKIDLDGGVKTQADVDRVKDSLQKERDTNEELQRKLSKVPDDFDAEKWGKVKDLDPDNPPGGGSVDKDSKEFQTAVSQAVREREREIKEELDSEHQSKLSEVERKEQAVIQDYKEGWIKQYLSEKFGFTDPKRLRWMMLDINSGQHPEIKKKLETIKVDFEGDRPKVVGGDLKDEQGAIEILENIASSDVSKDYKPASDNSGGGTPPGGGGGGAEVKNNPFKIGEHHNVTLQSKLINDEPEKARKLAKEAGWSEAEIARIGK